MNLVLSRHARLAMTLFVSLLVITPVVATPSPVYAAGNCPEGLTQVASGNVLLLDVTTNPAAYLQQGSVPNYNATGLNIEDGLIYGVDRTGSSPWNVVSFDPVDGSTAVVTTTNLQSYAGDFDAIGNLWHNAAGNTINKTDVSTGLTTTISLPSSSSVSDFGYVPTDGQFYGVRGGGTQMWIYDPVLNTSVNQPLSGPITAETGGFGAVWVVNSGLGFYAFNNASGNIFKIDLGTFVSTLQTASTPNGSNDGMACYDQNDPFTNPTADFGDAPDSYGTLGTSSGAGALIYPGLSMGTPADADLDGQPSADAAADSSDDGVTFDGATLQDAALPIGEAISITVNTATDAGFVSAWIDWDANGTFDVGEQVATDLVPSSGVVTINTAVPVSSVYGDSFARFRIAGRTGGTELNIYSYGEIEDYRVKFDARPVAVDDGPFVVQEEAAITVDVTTNDADPNNPIDPTDISLFTQASNGVAVYNGDGTFTYTGNAGFDGTDSFVYELCDIDGLCTTATVTFTVTDEGSPLANPDGPVVVGEDATTNIDATSNDDLTDDAVITSAGPASAQGGSVSIGAGGTVDYTPATAFVGADSFSYTICDDDSPTPTCSTATVTVTVTDEGSPVADPDGPISVGEDTTSATVIDVTADDTMIDDATLVSAGPSTEGATVVVSGGVVEYTPPAGYAGTDTFDYTICDDDTPTPTCSTATVTVDVVDEGSPVADPDGPIAVGEDTTSATVIDVTADDTMVDGAVLTSAGPSASGATVAVVGGMVEYTPAPGYSGADSFDYTICDDDMPTPTCSTATVTIDVVDQGSPVATPNGPVLIGEDTTTATVIDVTVDDTLVDGAALVSAGPTAAGATVSVVGGMVEYIPAPGFAGIDTFDYTICDDDSPAPTCSSATVTIDVLDEGSPIAVDDGPVPVVQDASSPVIIDVGANDTLTDNASVGAAGPSTAGGAITIIGPGLISYTPPANSVGTDTLLYVLCDDDSPTPTCSTATVTIEIQMDSDGDGIADVDDLDDDNDGIPDAVEGTVDTDGDSIPDGQDLDSDNDGIADIVEAGGTDADGDGMVDDPSDVNDDGLDDTIAANPLPVSDSDTDGLLDHLDDDSDNDGIPDSVEVGPDPSNPVDTDGDGLADMIDTDSDGNGIDDATEAGPDLSNPLDTDGDGIPDFADTDSDNDGISDADEIGGDPANPVDTDGDGIPDYLDALGVTISGQVWFDANRNGVLDPGEDDISGVVVQLISCGEDGLFGTADDTLVAETVTASPYVFENVEPGTYTVVVDSASLVNGLFATDDVDGGSDQQVFVTVTGDSDVVANDLGYAFPGLNGVILDTDGNPVAGAIVTITDSAGNVYTVVTDSSGAFSLNPSLDAPLVGPNVTISTLYPDGSVVVLNATLEGSNVAFASMQPTLPLTGLDSSSLTLAALALLILGGGLLFSTRRKQEST
ncbi:MAG: tandem-95 repeat protein [Acidimicrobiia bacterium]|nr:tandem-95 repeat protein [Acidimicrobiia bacterium]